MNWPEAFSPQAVRDVEAAVDWITESGGGPAVARRMVLATLAAARLVVARPQIGRTRPDLLPARFRFWAVRGFPYLLIYDADRSPAQVARVLHMARDLVLLLADLTEPPGEGGSD